MFLPARSRLCMLYESAPLEFTMYVLETLVSFCHLICLYIYEPNGSEQRRPDGECSCWCALISWKQGLRRHKGYGRWLCWFQSILLLVLPKLAMGLTLASKTTNSVINSSCNIWYSVRVYMGRTIDWICERIHNKTSIQQKTLPT